MFLLRGFLGWICEIILNFSFRWAVYLYRCSQTKSDLRDKFFALTGTFTSACHQGSIHLGAFSAPWCPRQQEYDIFNSQAGSYVCGSWEYLIRSLNMQYLLAGMPDMRLSTQHPGAPKAGQVSDARPSLALP